MNYFENQRRSIRLAKIDYSRSGKYFITICVKDKKCFFGKIVDKCMVLSKLGTIVRKCWLEIPKHYPIVRLDSFIIMPNHIHGIIEIIDQDMIDNLNEGKVGAEYIQPEKGVQNIEPLPKKANQYQRIISGSIGAIIRGYKIGVINWCKQNQLEYFQW